MKSGCIDGTVKILKLLYCYLLQYAFYPTNLSGARELLFK